MIKYVKGDAVKYTSEKYKEELFAQGWKIEGNEPQSEVIEGNEPEIKEKKSRKKSEDK